MNNPPNKTCFLDRDGVVIQDSNYLKDPEKVILFPETVEAFKLLKQNGFRIFIVSNQSGVARGYFTMDDVFSIERKIETLLKNAGAPVPDGWYDCPHHPKGIAAEFSVDCSCRKPKPGLFLRAAAEHCVSFSESVVIGDKISDLEAGFAAGCVRGALVRTGHGKEQTAVPLAQPYLICRNILEAVRELTACSFHEDDRKISD